MSRPRSPRRVGFRPDVTHFKPAGVPLAGLEEVVLTFDEVEALRLRDVEYLGQSKAAKKMNVSQPTFFRILSLARKKAADAIVNGKAIRVEGGTYSYSGTVAGGGPGADKGAGRGAGRGFRGGR